jgi:outer membrane lipoprotein-sorting protein
VILPALWLAAVALAEDLPTPEQVLELIDQNLTFESRTTKVAMTVESGKRVKTYEMMTFGRGQDQAAIEYLEPARDKGTRMLRLGEDMWLYMPSIERTQKISGHMLREGMMGSDVSYEDMASASKLRDQYTATVVGAEELDGRKVYKLELVATDESVSYPKRTSWVDAELGIPVKQELYALSGMLLKTWEMSDVKPFDGGRQFPTRMVVEDKVRASSKTTLVFTEVQFGVALEDEVFDTRWLERKQ